MEWLTEYVSSSLSEYFDPPTARERMRAGRNALRHERTAMDRQVAAAEREFDGVMRTLRARAPSLDEAGLRELAREAANRKLALRQMSASSRQLATADARLVMAASTQAVRDSIRVTAEALGSTAEGGMEAVAADVKDMMKQQYMADAMSEAVCDALADDDENKVLEGTVDSIMDEIRSSVSSQLPTAPAAPVRVAPPPPEQETLTAEEEDLVRRMNALRGRSE